MKKIFEERKQVGLWEYRDYIPAGEVLRGQS